MRNISNNQNRQPIGVFDSGVGGLSVLLELKKALPNENFVFLADQFYLPYGEKSKKELVSRVYKVTDYFIKFHNIKMLIVACNTATSNAIDDLRKKYAFPFVGTIPAVKVAAQKTRTGTISVISTVSTSKSQALQSLIKEHCQNINVINIGCKSLVELIEKGELEGPKVSDLLLKYLKPVLNSSADHLVLGCTHYPFLKKAIQKIVGKGVELIDSSLAIAKQAESLLVKHNMENTLKGKRKVIYFTTGNSIKFSKFATFLLKNQIKAEKVNI